MSEVPRVSAAASNFGTKMYSGIPLYGHPLNTDTRILRTVSFVQTKSSNISLKLTRLMWTPVNTDNGHFSVSRVTNSHTLSTPLFGHSLSVFCLFSTFLTGLSNIQFHLAEAQTKRVSTKKTSRTFSNNSVFVFQ